MRTLPRTAAGATGVPGLCSSGSQPGVSLPSMGLIALSGDIFDHHDWGVRAIGTLRVEARGAAR